MINRDSYLCFIFIFLSCAIEQPNWRSIRTLTREHLENSPVFTWFASFDTGVVCELKVIVEYTIAAESIGNRNFFQTGSSKGDSLPRLLAISGREDYNGGQRWAVSPGK